MKHKMPGKLIDLNSFDINKLIKSPSFFSHENLISDTECTEKVKQQVFHR